MSRTVGVEIGAERIRAVVRPGRGALQTFEVPFTPDRLDDLVAQLADAVGNVSGIGLAIGLAHLHVKQVKLPPVPHAARRQMLSLEPERWFTVSQGAPTAVSLTANGELAFGADGDLVEACVRAFSAWGTVRRIEAAPLALTRALNAAGHRTVNASIDAGIDEAGVVTTQDGALRMVRRARATDLSATPNSPQTAVGLDAGFSVAFGAACALDSDIETMLLTPSIERGFAAIRRRRVATWATAAVLSVCLGAWAAGVSRDRQLNALESALLKERSAAEGGNALVLRAMTIDRELAAIVSTSASRADVPGALAALGHRLPVQAVAQRVRMVGSEWQVEGNAVKAAAVLASLAAEPRFEKVRFLAPSNRFRDGANDRETFAIAFTVR